MVKWAKKWGADVVIGQFEANEPVELFRQPGIVAIAQLTGYRVLPLVGPSSMIMAVMASGLSGQNFAFNGYLPIDPSDRLKRLKQLEARAFQEHQTQLFIETPYRNVKLFEAILTACRPQTRLCIAAGITTSDEWIHTRTIAEWKRQSLPDLSKIPAIFLIGGTE